MTLAKALAPLFQHQRAAECGQLEPFLTITSKDGGFFCRHGIQKVLQLKWIRSSSEEAPDRHGPSRQQPANMVKLEFATVIDLPC
jgi:hypothetical protein